MDTFYFDDEVKLDVFHKNSSLKTNMTGKGIISLSNFSLDNTSVIPVPIYNKKIMRTVGYVYVRVNYKPLDQALFDQEWLTELEASNKIDKYQYFNSYLANEFKNVCHCGYI